MALVPKAMYRFNVISIKLPMALIHRTNSSPPPPPQFILNHERPRNAKAIQKEKVKAEGKRLLDFRQYCRVKLAWCWH